MTPEREARFRLMMARYPGEGYLNRFCNAEDIVSLLAQRDALREALKKYGDHLDPVTEGPHAGSECRSYLGHDCICGYTEAQKL